MKSKAIHLVILLTVIGITTLGCRLLYTRSLFLSFLVWNLFLAFVPLFISSYIIKRNKRGIPLVLLLFTWILFLPNAPYIVTDFIHLHNFRSVFWIDLICITAFALSGFLSGIYSMHQIHQYLIKSITKRWIWVFITVLSFLSGLGIFLGRIYRFNSWDVLHKPTDLLKSIVRLVFHPIVYKEAWLLSISFGILILVSYIAIQRLLVIKKE